MKRREFITLSGGAAASSVLSPFVARAQRPAMPVIGFVSVNSPQDWARPLSAFLRGLDETGYVDGGNVAIEFRWAQGQNDRLPAMVADLAQRHVAMIAATGTPAALAAKAATTTIPIVFEAAADPVKLGLVASLNRPGGNITGVTQMNVEVAPKRLELLHEVLPTVRIMGLLVDPRDPVLADSQTKDFLAAAQTLGVELHILNARTEADFDAVFGNLAQLRAGGLAIATDAFFTGHSEQLATLAAHRAVPAVYKGREFATAGGLLSYGTDIAETYHLAGTYTGRILKGEKPADLPVQQATKVELFINLKSAKALGITMPLTLLGRADEVFE